MIFSEAPGGAYVGSGYYSKIGYGLSFNNGSYYLSAPSPDLLDDQMSPYQEWAPVRTSEIVTWSGSQKDDQVEDTLAVYWDSETEKFAYAPDGYGFVLRPYFFDALYVPKFFQVLHKISASSTKRAHYKNVLDDTTNGMHLCPVFWTEKGLALPDYSTASTWNFPSFQSGASGLTLNDLLIRVHSAPYPVVGICLVGAMDSTAAGGLINQRTEDLPTAYIGQTDGSAYFAVSGISKCWLGISSSVFRSQMLSFLPWSGKTIKEVCSVKNVRGGIE